MTVSERILRVLEYGLLLLLLLAAVRAAMTGRV